ALKTPSIEFDPRYYARLPTVRADLRQHRATDAFTHYLTIGRAQGLSPALPPKEQVSEPQARALFQRKTEHLLPVFARAPLSFACEGMPDVTAVMPVHQRLAATLSSIASLRYAHPGPIELILLDAGGEIETGQIERFVEGAWVLRLDVQLGRTRSRNAGLRN